MPRFGKDGPSIDAIADAAMALFQKATETLPCTRLALSAHDFAPAALTEQQGAITRFFAGPAAVRTGAAAFHPSAKVADVVSFRLLAVVVNCTQLVCMSSTCH